MFKNSVVKFDKLTASGVVPHISEYLRFITLYAPPLGIILIVTLKLLLSASVILAFFSNISFSFSFFTQKVFRSIWKFLNLKDLLVNHLLQDIFPMILLNILYSHLNTVAVFVFPFVKVQ